MKLNSTLSARFWKPLVNSSLQFDKNPNLSLILSTSMALTMYNSHTTRAENACNQQNAVVPSLSGAPYVSEEHETILCLIPTIILFEDISKISNSHYNSSNLALEVRRLCASESLSRENGPAFDEQHSLQVRSSNNVGTKDNSRRVTALGTNNVCGTSSPFTTISRTRRLPAYQLRCHRPIRTYLQPAIAFGYTCNVSTHAC